MYLRSFLSRLDHRVVLVHRRKSARVEADARPHLHPALKSLRANIHNAIAGIKHVKGKQRYRSKDARG